MSLDKTRMATNIANKLESAGIITEDKKPEVINIWKEICDGIITEISSNAEVATNVTGKADLVTGDVTGTGSGGVS